MSTSYFKSEAKRALNGKWQTFSVCVLIFTAINLLFNAPTLIQEITELVSYLSDEALYEPSLTTDIRKSLLSDVLLPFFRLLYQALLLPHLSFSLRAIALNVTGNKEIKVSDIFNGFKNYSNVLLLYLLETLNIFLWALLLIIPGIIKEISYSMSHFIMAENPDMSPSEVLKESEELMEGHKLDYFILQLSFFGWNILSVLTLGLSARYSDPYYHAARANFYYTIKKEKYGDATPYGKSDEMYIQYPYDYVTNQPIQEHESQYNSEAQTVEPTYTYLGNMNTSTPSQETLTETEDSEETL